MDIGAKRIGTKRKRGGPSASIARLDKAASRAGRAAGTPVPVAAAARHNARVSKAAARRSAILHAALDEFAVRGFAAARLDDVARRAGVAKGTIYLHFKDKEALFQELIRFHLNPVVGIFETVFASDVPLRAVVDQAIEIFVREIYGTHRKEVMGLIISEGPRFPALAEFYYREVLARMLKAVRARLRRALECGEIADDTLIRFPQLLGAASVIAIIWHGLFDRFEPLNVPALMRAYFDRLLLPAGRRA
jgi:AcrR family transcriptional regulator